MDFVGELHVVGETVYSNPVDRLIVGRVLLKLGDLASLVFFHALDDGVAEHALLYGRDASRALFCNCSMAERAVDAQLACVSDVSETNRLCRSCLGDKL
ncbi:MAG: hypothetical protein C1O27_000540 [Chloroflexi bacterium]|nr:MAG: hypothetical protein C1O27_000540 [Chloroflexota bacterium]